MSDADTSDDVVATDAPEDDATAAPRPTRLDVRAVLDEIGAEDAIAHLEARVAGLEQELERSDNRAREGDRSRRGELDLMRARIEDALALVREAMEEQRGSFRDFEERFTGLVSAAEEASRTFVDELREDLTPRVQKAVHRVDAARAELKGEVAAVAGDAETRAAAQAESLVTARSELEAALADLRAAVTREVEERAATLATLEQRLATRLDELEATTSQRLEEQHDRTEALRRELDAASGELRAGMNLKVNELRDALAELHTELGQAIDDQADGAAELERRWIEGTRDIARRIEQVQREVQETVQAERGVRSQATDELRSRLDEVAGVVEELHGRIGSDVARRGTELETVKREHEELANRLDVLQSKVAQAVSQIASQLTNRVAQLAGDLDALRESSGRHQERLAAVDHAERRIAELAAAQERLAAERAVPEAQDTERLDRMEATLHELRQQVSALSGTVSETRQQTRDVAAGIGGITQSVRSQEGLRQEVRELAARSSELAHRLDETEKLARAAGQAIASAVRKARAGGGTAAAAPRTPVSERASIFGDRPRTVRRDDQGEPIVGMDHLSGPAPSEDGAVSPEDLRALERIEASSEGSEDSED